MKLTIAIVSSIVSAMLIVFLFADSRNKQIDELHKIIFESAEYGYFEGQKDAINDDIRIKKVNDSYEWIKSP